ncbi:MAG TPA: ABC transporter permease [Methanospirillum sp.]|nr:ABC transporter permease [Methanospirillum sp.]
MVAIFTRDFKKFTSKPFVVVMTLMMPVMYLVIFGNAMGGTISHIPIAVVQEGPPYTETPLFTAAAYALNHIHQKDPNPKLLDVTVYPDEAKAKYALSKGLITAVVILPSEVTKTNIIRLYVDSADSITPALVESAVSGVIHKIGNNNPIQINEIYGDIKYIQFFGVGVIVMAIFTSTMFGGGIALIKDREAGIHEGYLVTPVQRTSIIAGIIASGTIRAFFAGGTIFLIDLLITGITLRSIESLLLVFVVILIACIGVTSLVVSFASRFSEQQEFASVVAFLNLILFMTSGAFYPVIGMPDWLRWITVINPEYYAVHALRGIILRGQGLDVIGADLIALLIFSSIMIVLGITTFRRTME